MAQNAQQLALQQLPPHYNPALARDVAYVEVLSSPKMMEVEANLIPGPTASTTFAPKHLDCCLLEQVTPDFRATSHANTEEPGFAAQVARTPLCLSPFQVLNLPTMLEGQAIQALRTVTQITNLPIHANHEREDLPARRAGDHAVSLPRARGQLNSVR